MDRLHALAREPRLTVAPRRALPGAARGIAVSGGVVFASPLARALFVPVFDTLDLVHGDGRIPCIQVRLVQDLNDEEGTFAPEPLPHIPGGQVLVSAIPALPRMTLLHELGHVVDGYGFGVGRYYGSARMDRFERWRRAVRESPSVKRLHANLDDLVLPATERTYLGYLLLPTELWARSYTQYIALHTDDDRFDRELTRFLAEDAGSRDSSQWNDQEFRAIAEAIDHLLRSMSWQR